MRGRLVVAAVGFGVLFFPGCAAKTINSTGVDGERGGRRAKVFTVYILGGQSNMVGSSTPTTSLESRLQSPQTDVLFYFDNRDPSTLPPKKWIPRRIFAGHGTSSVNMKFASVVRAAQMAVADADPQIDWIDLDNLPQQDAGVEFNGPGTIEMGRRFGAAMQKLTGSRTQSGRFTHSVREAHSRVSRDAT